MNSGIPAGTRFGTQIDRGYNVIGTLLLYSRRGECDMEKIKYEIVPLRDGADKYNIFKIKRRTRVAVQLPTDYFFSLKI